MKKTFCKAAALITITAALLVSCGTTKSAGVDLYTNDNKIPYGDRLEIEGAAGVERQADVKNSIYYPSIDFYNMKSDKNLTVLSNFKTIQQATEWTCGPTSALMAVEWFGKREDMNEMDLVALRQKDEPGATNLQQMINIFEGLGGYEITSTYDLENPETIPEDMIQTYLKDGVPVIIGTDDWAGHWQVVIGYDNLGTEATADDVLIIADPYDTTDHNQDGYITFPFERLYYNWKNGFDPDFKRNVFIAIKPAK